MKAAEPIVIDHVVVPPGTHKLIEIEIARLTSGTLITMPVHVFRSKNAGPTVLLSGGLHGDEINGIEIVRRMIAGNTLKKIKKGTVIAIPIINIYGFLFFSRDVPDGKDVNRSFPGSPDGSLASLVAHTITTKILPIIDFGIDFHTGGASRTNFPQIRYSKQDQLAQEIAEAFQAPFTLHSPVIQGSLRMSAKELNKSIVVFEGGESLRFDSRAIEEGIRGVKRVLHHFGMSINTPRSRANHFFGESHWLRADASGLFQFRKESGDAVEKGELIGRIHNPYNSYTVKVFSPYNGYIIGHNNMPMVHRGDALFHIGLENFVDE